MSATTIAVDSTIVSHQDHKPAIFYPCAVEYTYPESLGMVDPKGNNAYLPLEIDTEFYHPKLDFHGITPSLLSPTITVQVRPVGLNEGVIFTHNDCAAYARHPLAVADFIVVDYLRSLGHEVTLERASALLEDLPWIEIDLYAFFAVAELLRVVRNDCREDVVRLTLEAEAKGTGIVQGRRLRSFTKIRGEYLSWVQMPWVMTLNGIQYAVRLALWDTCAVHGATGYAGFCSNTGTPIPYKDVFSGVEKADMLSQYVKRPDDFDNYALGDLYNHTALMNNIELFKTVYDSVSLDQFYRIPRLTTGATVRDLMEAVIQREFVNIHPGIKPRELVNAYCKHGTAAELKKRTTTTAAFNAKVDGGRCRNNRPTDTVIKDVLCDLDISGCYGEGLRVQLYPFGIPVILDYPLDAPENQFLSLGDFLKRYGKQLVPGAWQARVSLREGVRLKYPQDFLMSWFPPRDVRKLASDSELSETDEWWGVDNVGLTKVFTRQVHLALINHDFVQWLDNVASTRQRKELLEKLYVVTAMYYPASDRVDSVEALRNAHNAHTGKNTCTIKRVKGKTTKISVSQQCHTWYGVTLGDLFITELLRERKKHPKKTPLNELYKLCINTTFGDMVSPYFAVGNVVVGNNITARARALAWYMEKGLHGWQTITDGCAFDLNRVLHPDQVRVNGENVVGLYREQSRNIHLQFKALGGYDHIALQGLADGLYGLNLAHKCNEQSDNCMTSYISCHTLSDNCITPLDSKQSLDWVNRAAMEHLQELFPSVDVLHQMTSDVEGKSRKGQFGFEAKGLYDGGVFHGSGNYLFTRFGEPDVVKMRSYSKKAQETVNTAQFVSEENYYPSKTFLNGLLNNVHSLQRQPVFLKPGILKVGDFSRHYGHRYEGSGAFPGMTTKTAALLREYSLTQFSYQDLEQYQGWVQESNLLRKRYGQSYEMYFLNSDQTLNYQLMVETIDDRIAAGMTGFWDGIDKRSKHGYRQQSEHPALETLEATRKNLAGYYGYKTIWSQEDDADGSGGDESFTSEDDD